MFMTIYKLNILLNAEIGRLSWKNLSAFQNGFAINKPKKDHPLITIKSA